MKDALEKLQQATERYKALIEESREDVERPDVWRAWVELEAAFQEVDRILRDW